MGFFKNFILIGFLAGLSQAYDTPNCEGDRTVIVHLFNWKWTSIAEECERFLGPKGFCGVQVSPPNEHRIVTGDKNRPWWERYQPVSYKLVSRSGNEEEFADMTRRCNAVGVKIYVDVVINHMCGVDAGRGTGTAGSDYDTGSLTFGGVPYSANDFNCCNCEKCTSGSCNIESYGDVNQVRNCRLVGLLDLDLSKEYVRGKIVEFMNNLLNIGVAGFRVDACKHMWPGDVEAMWNGLNNLNEQFHPQNTRPFMFNEVIDQGGEPIGAGEYTHLGRVTEFKFCGNIARPFRGQAALKDLKNFGEGWGMLPSNKAFVFVDNHDNQRGHGGGGNILTFYQEREYKMATEFKLAHPYGFTRIMSSYRWPGGPSDNDWWGPPRNEDWTIKDVNIKPDGTCDDDWVCEHRWRQITNMVKFRNVAGDAPIENWWDNGNNQIAFSRGNRAFIAFNTEGHALTQTLQTGLPEGSYCDVISGNLEGGSCTGITVNVNSNGQASINIDNNSPDPVIAIHAESRTGGGNPGTTNSPPSTNTPGPTVTPPTGTSRTVILLKFQSSVGQNVFLRGGIDHTQRPGCSNDAATSPCAISIDHNDVGSTPHYDGYNAWKVGDTKLDWYGAETGQGSFGGARAEGSPSVWTSNQASSPGYQPVNKYGDHYWMFDVNMDCSQTENGWFEFKGFATNYATNGGWEFDITQSVVCSGTAGGSKPSYSTKNHFGRCGFVNVFTWSANGCQIDNF